MPQPRRNEQSGQSGVQLALMLLIIVGMMAIAVDGGSALNKRRIAQNAADAAALTGARYITVTNAPTEAGLREQINTIVEFHGVPDTDGSEGNAINDNITVFYTNDRGVRLTGCTQLPCGTIPAPASGVEVIVEIPFSTFLAVIIGQSRARVGAESIAYASNTGGGGPNENAMVALGDCPQSDIPFDGSGNGSEVIGNIHSNSWLEARGNDIHFHGPATYVDGFVETGRDNEFEPTLPAPTTALTDPYAGLQVSDFAPGSAIAAAHAGNYYNLSGFSEIIDLRLLRDEGLYDESTKTLAEGIYYAGNNDFSFGDRGMRGTITLVTHGTIKITERDVVLTAFMPDGSAVPGLLFFTDRLADPTNPCLNGIDSYVINLTGTSSNKRPQVEHDGDCPYPVSDGCYTLSTNVYVGLIYAPRGRIATSGDNGSFIGAIVGYTVRLNGYNSLIVANPNLFPSGDPFIYLGK